MAARKPAAPGEILAGRGMGYAQRNGAENALVAEIEVNTSTGAIWVRKFTIASDHYRRPRAQGSAHAGAGEGGLDAAVSL